MTNRSTRAGEAIKLRTRFLDDLGVSAEASDVFVHIYEPGTTEFEFENAYTVSGEAIYIGEGIFEYQFTPPNTDGIWYDVWEGILTGQDLEATLEFEVSASGTITELPENQLWQNNLITITLPSGIESTDSSVMEEPFDFEFLTTINPAYTNIRKVMLHIGGFVNGLEDDVIQTAILEASIEADVMTWTAAPNNLSIFNHARREYTTCLASSMLVTALTSTSLKSKTLGDLRVEYDPYGLRNALNKIDDCLSKWESQLVAGGGALGNKNPAMVIKGEYDPDRIRVGRMWQSTDSNYSSRVPVGNTRERPIFSRRTSKTYRRRLW